MKKSIVVIFAYLWVYAACYGENPATHEQDLRVFEANHEFQLALDLNSHNNIGSSDK